MLAAAHWKLHKRPAGRDCYGAQDPAFFKTPTEQTKVEGGCGGGMDPWARDTAEMYQREKQQADREIQRLERAVADLRLKLGAYEQEEESARMGFQRGGQPRGHNDDEAGVQRDGAGQRLPVQMQNGVGDHARPGEQYFGGLSSMS